MLLIADDTIVISCTKSAITLHVILFIKKLTALHYLILQAKNQNTDKTGQWVYGCIVECQYVLQCFDAVGWVAGRASGL